MIKFFTFTHYTRTDKEREISVPARYEVCSRCDGTGTHVNPSIDGNGLTYEDFAEDPDFEEAYFSGIYDVNCYECKGNRVTLVPDETAMTRRQKFLYDKWSEEQYHYDAERRAEERFGC